MFSGRCGSSPPLDSPPRADQRAAPVSPDHAASSASSLELHRRRMALQGQHHIDRLAAETAGIRIEPLSKHKKRRRSAY